MSKYPAVLSAKQIDTPPMNLRQLGFQKPRNIASIRRGNYADLPRQAGVYVILRPTRFRRSFLAESPAHWFKGRDPTLDVAYLQQRWCSESRILYIGKAGRARGQSTIQSRLKAYFRFGAGQSGAHWGGRAIWQLKRSESLLVAWRVTAPSKARAMEKRLLECHEGRYGRRPFANLKG